MAAAASSATASAFGAPVRVSAASAPVPAAAAAPASAPALVMEQRVSSLFEKYLPHLLEIAVLQDHYGRGGDVLCPSWKSIGLKPYFLERLSAAAYDKFFVDDPSEDGTRDQHVSSWLRGKQAIFRTMKVEMETVLEAELTPLVAPFLSSLGFSSLYFLKPTLNNIEPFYLSLRERYQGAVSKRFLDGFSETRKEAVKSLQTHFTLSEALKETIDAFLPQLIEAVSLGYLFSLEPLKPGDKIYTTEAGVISKSSAPQVFLGRILQATARTMYSIAGFKCSVDATVEWLKLYRSRLSVVDQLLPSLEQQEEVRYFAIFARWASPFLKASQKSLTTLYQTYNKDTHLNLEYVECMSEINRLFEKFFKRLAECEEACQKMGFTLPRFEPDFTPTPYDEEPSELDPSSAIGDDLPSSLAAAPPSSAADAPPVSHARAASPPPAEELQEHADTA